VLRHRGRTRALATITALLAGLLVAANPVIANAAGTVLFQNSFANRTVDGIGTVTVPTPPSGANAVCLTAYGNYSTPPVLSCGDTSDYQGGGKLRLTPNSTTQVGGVFGATSFPTSSGLDVTFTSYQWGGGAADGIAFMLAAVDPANPAAPTVIGPPGGSLGYSPAAGARGLPNAYLGVGLDVYGNFSSNEYSGSGCTNPANISTAVPGAVVVRGPGNGLVGYCGLGSTWNGTTTSKVTLRASTRSGAAVPVQVLVNPTTATLVSDSGVSTAAGTYKVVVTPVGQTARMITGPLPSVSSGLYPSTTWLNAAGVPRQLAFGLVGSTGGMTDTHEISNVKAVTFNPVPQLAVSTTSFSTASPAPGAPVTYKVATSVLAGANENSPISVTQTTPTGVLPVGAYGTGWVCAAPVGQTITCTTSGSSFTNGTALPVLTVVAIVTGTTMTSTIVQNNSPSRVSSADGSPATDSVTTAGAVPTAPGSVTATPSAGPIAGGNTVTINGTNITAATAIEIGTTAEQTAGRPVVLLPCPGAAAAGCFTVSGSTLVISSMPARTSTATVSITVVTAGVAGAASYLYVDKPAAPAAPVATAGITSASLTWTAPAANGSAITGYVVTAYLNGVAQSAQSFDTTTTTRTISGLTAGGSYTFTVAAVNAYGTSNASAPSNAVVPYALPGAPTNLVATAGSAAANLSWTAPANNGSAITGYVVTPYIGLTAQATQFFTGAGTAQTATGLTPGTAYTFTVAAQNAAGTGPASAKSSPVTPNALPSLVFTAPPAGQVGVAYSHQLTVTGGTAPFTWSISTGALPAGLALNASTGLLSGTPTASGTFTFTVRVLDASGQAVTKSVTLVIAAAPAVVFTAPSGEVGVAYSGQPTTTGGTAPFTWTISAGALPSGVSINASTGLISGTPTASGSFSVTITATDSFGQTSNKTTTLVIAAQPAFTTTPPPAGRVGAAYTTTFDVTGGVAPFTWAISAGSTPAGLSFNTGTGVLSGTPTTTGSTSFTVRVTDANGQTATKAVTLVIEVGSLVIVKTANTSSATPGTVVGYTIAITNSGTSAATGVVLSDPLTGVLDDAVYNGNAAATSGTTSYTAPTLGWTGSVAAGATVTITYTVTVRNPDTGNKVLSNTATSSTLGTNCASGSSDARCSATVTVPGLTMVKTSNVTTTTPGGTVGFTIVVTNSGQTPYTSAALTDDLAGVVDDAVYNGDAMTTAGTLSYTGSTLTWSGALAVGGTATITYTVTVRNPDTGNRSLTGTIVSSTPGSTCPATGPAAECTATVTVLVPALVITNSANTSTTTPGDVVTYTVTLANTGQTAYTAISATIAFADALDDATYNNDATTSTGSIALDGGTNSLMWSGDVAIGVVVTITGSVTVRDPDPGDKVLTTVATSSAPGSNCPTAGAQPACTSTVQVRVPHLAITTAADVGSTTPGSVVHYTVSVTNDGQTAYSAAGFTVALGGVLDDATYNGDVAASAGSVSLSGSAITWTGALAIGATATTTYSVTVSSPTTGDLALTTVVTSTTAGTNCPAAGTDPRCASTVAVLIPALTISESVDATTTTPGSVLRYSLLLVNTGQTAYQDVSVTLDVTGLVDDATYNNDATTSTGSIMPNPDGTATWVLDLAVGASATTTMSATVTDPPTGDRTIRTVVSSSAAGSTCPVGSANASCHNDVPVLLPGLSITKSANTSTALPGGTVAYTITVANTGESAYAAATFTDNLTKVLADAVYQADANASSGTVDYTSPVLTWTGQLDPGETATITFSVVVRDPDPGDKVMVNTVVSTSANSNCPAGGSDTACTSTVWVMVPGLTIAKTANAATTVPGAVIGYTVTATNSGTAPLTGATFTDALAGVLDDAAYNGDAAASAGVVGYAGSALTWTGDLAVGASATITYTVTVHAADGGDNLVTGTITSSTKGSNCATGSVDPRCAGTVPVARLVLSQSYEQPTTTPGSVVRLNASFVNTGQVPYTGITVSSLSEDTVDDAIPTGDQVATSGTLVLSSTAISWTGSIPVGGSVSITGTLTVKDPATGNKLITGTLVSTAPGNTCPPGGTSPGCTALTTVLVPGLTITKTANTSATVQGGTVGYTILVRNTGQTPYTAAVVTDALGAVLNKATYNGDATATSGTVVFSAPTLTWTGDLAVGATATIAYTVTVGSMPSNDKTMVNSVSSGATGSTCPPGAGTPACQSIVAILTAALTISQTPDLLNATLGTTVTYTVLVTNSGQLPYSAAAFTTSLADLLDDAAYNTASATSGTVGYTGDVLSWTGALSPGASATITYSVTIDNPSTGTLSMVTTAESTSSGSNCPAGAGDSRCTATVAITNAVSLTFTKTASTTATTAGSTVDYTITIVNSSGSPVVDANFTDSLSGLLDDAVYNNDATTGVGTLGYTSPDLSWTGTVPAGGTATVTYSVTVNSAVTGDQVLGNGLVSASPTTSNNCLVDTEDPRCTTTVPIAALRLEQHYTESTTTPGSVVHLTATFTNTGKYPYTGITISSPTTNSIDDANPNGDQVATSGTLVLSSSAITWTGNIPVGGTVTVTGTLTVRNPDLGDRLLTGTLVSTALGNTCLPGSTNTGCTSYLPVLVPGLTMTKTANTTFVVPGGTATYTITVHNTGETPQLGVSVADTLVGVLDDATYNANATANLGSVAYSAPVLTWTGDLAVGATATITYSVTAQGTATGDKTMVNPISSSSAGSTCPPASGNTACRSTVVVLTPLLTTSITADKVTTIPGATVTYTITAANTGQTPYAAANFSVALGDVLDNAAYAGGASASTGTVGVASGTLTWTGALGTGTTATITFAVTVGQFTTGDFRMDQTIVSTSQGTNCPAASTDPRCASSVPIANLRIVNAADVTTAKPTDVIHFTITFTNTGQVPYTGISITDSFAGAGDDVTYNGDAAVTSGSVMLDYTTGGVVWTGDLAVGAVATVTGSVTVNNPDLGDQIVSALVTTAAPGSNCAVGSADPLCLATVEVLTPALTVAVSASTSTSTPGSDVSYTITVTNSGPTAYTAAVVRELLHGVLDDAAYNNDATADRGSVTFADPVLTWTGDLPVGESAVIGFSVRIDSPDLGDKTMVAGAVSDELGSNCATGSSDPSCTTYVTVLTPALDIAVTADRTTTVPGATVGYTVTIHNTGQTDSPGTVVTIALGGVLDDAAYGGGATADSGTLGYTSPTLTWTGDVDMGDTVVVTYAVVVSSPDDGDKALTTSVSSSAPGSTCGAAAQCANTVTVLIPGLAVSTTASATSVLPGALVVFTITIANTGQTPYTGTTASTDLSDVLDDADLTGVVTASTGVAGYSAPNLVWTGTLAAGATATVSYSVTVRNPDPGDRVLSTTVIAPAAGSTCQASSDAPDCTAEVTVLVPGLSITLSADRTTATPGSTIRYTIVITNTGETPYEDVVVDDLLDNSLNDAAYQDDATVLGGGVLSFAGTTLTWTGDLLVGATATIDYTLVVNDPDNGDKHLVNTVTSTAFGSTCPPGGTATGCSAVVDVLVPGLLLSKTANTTEVTAGDAVLYTVTATNTGQTPYAPAVFTDPLTGVLDDAVYGGDASATSGAVDYTAGTLVWTGPLAIGATVTVTYSVTTLYPATGDRALRNTVLSDSPGSNCATDSDPRCTAETAVLVPSLTITKTADTSSVVGSGTVAYTIAATNTGEADYPAATFEDSLENVLTEGVYGDDATTTTGTLDYADSTLRWTGRLVVGATVVIHYTVLITADSDGGSLTNTVVSTSAGSNCPAAGTDPACSSSITEIALAVTLTDLTPSFTVTGPPDTTVTADGAMTMTVITNSPGGYTVSVRAKTETLTGATPGNSDTIPIGSLGVRESGTSTYSPLSTQSQVVHQQTWPSAPGGDAVSNDFRVDIPFVTSDSYTVELEYIVSTR
jgi:uncharacterized repeat protein (TIGR01451 family)